MIWNMMVYFNTCCNLAEGDLGNGLRLIENEKLLKNNHCGVAFSGSMRMLLLLGHGMGPTVETTWTSCCSWNYRDTHDLCNGHIYMTFS